jgi:hypothetical protein
MTKTIVALYDDIVVARQVVEDLVDADFERSSISLITNDANNQYSHFLDKDHTPREDAVTAGEGAGFGAVVGGLTGILVGLAALTIPGIGLAIAAGPIVGALTGALAGAVTGGIVGALVKSGVPEDEAPYYAEGIRRGGTLVSIETDDTLRAADIINRYGSVNIHERIDVWRQAGWEGFNPEANEDTAKPSPGIRPAVTSDTTITRVTHVRHGASPLSVAPVIEAEPLFEDEDTAESIQVTPMPDVVAGGPAIPMGEPEPQYDDEDLARSLQDIGPSTNHSKG